MQKSGLLQKKWFWIALASLVLLVIIFVVALTVRSNRVYKVDMLSVGRITELGWENITPVLDNGGAAIIEKNNGNDVYLILGRSSESGATSWREYFVKVERNKQDGQDRCIITLHHANSAVNTEDMVRNEYGKRLPVAVYHFKRKDSEAIEIYLDDQTSIEYLHLHEEVLGKLIR